MKYKQNLTMCSTVATESEIYAILEDGKKCFREVEEMFIRYEENIKALKISGEEKSMKNKKIENALLKMKKDLEITKETNKTLEYKIKVYIYIYILIPLLILISISYIYICYLYLYVLPFITFWEYYS